MRKPPTELPARYRTGFPWQLDKRARASREIAADMVRLWSDLGGVDALSTQQLMVVERLTFLRQRLIQHEQATLNGKEPPMSSNEYVAAVNTTLGLLKALGLQRQARDVDDLNSWLRREIDAEDALDAGDDAP